MPKTSCKSYSDLVSVLSNQDHREKEFLSLDTTKPAMGWFNNIAIGMYKTFRSKDSPINEKDIRQAIIDHYGKEDKIMAMATKYILLLEKHPALEEIMNRFTWKQVSAMEELGKVKWVDDTIGGGLDPNTLPINVLNNMINELQGRIRQGYGENIGKKFLWGLFGPVDAQLTTPKTMARKESTGAIDKMRTSITDFPRKLARVTRRFSRADYTGEDFVKLKNQAIKNRDYGMEDILTRIDLLSTDESLAKLKMPKAKATLHDMFVWYNTRDDMYNKEDDEKGNRRLKIDKDGNMTIARDYVAARDEKGNLIQWDKPSEGLKTRSAKYQFINYVPLEEYYVDQKTGEKFSVPMSTKMKEKFKHEGDRYEQLHKNVHHYFTTEAEKNEKILYNKLKSLVPKNWDDEDITGLFFKEDPRNFTRKKYDSEGNLKEVVSWADLNKEQQQLISIIHKHATRYNVLKPFIFNGRNEEEGPSEGRISFPITYAEMDFSPMWDDMIEEYSTEIKEIEEDLENPDLINPKTSEDKQLKFKLKQKRKILLSIVNRAKRIRDRKDDYPIDLTTGTYLALGEDSQHVKHISNQFNILGARTDPGAYFAYLRHQITRNERNILSIDLIDSLQRARSEPVQDYILNLYKVALYQPDAASGFGWLKLDSDSVSKVFGKVGINISAAKIDRKSRQILSYVSGNLLRGWNTAAQNYTAIIQKFIDVGMERVIEAMDLMETGGKDLERLVALSGVVDFREFFSRSLTNDAKNLGGRNKDAMALTAAMIRYWKAADGKTEAQKRALREKLEEDFGRAIKSIPDLPRLKKRRKVQKDIHRTNLLRKWVDYAINKEYEAAQYLKNKYVKTGWSLAEQWARVQREHAPTMGKTEQALRMMSFIIGVRASMRKGYIEDKNLADLFKNKKELEQAIEMGVDYVEQMDFGLSRQDLGQFGHGNIGAFFTQFKVWSMQKFAKDLETVRLAYQELRNVDNKYFDFKATAQMFESLVRHNKYSQKHLRTVSPRLAAFRAWIFSQGLWTALWDFGIMGPLAIVPGGKKLMRMVPGVRTIGGSTSDLISLTLLVPGLAVAMSYGEGDDEWEKILDYYTRKTFFGFGARWSMDAFLAMIAYMQDEDEDEYKNRLNKVARPLLPPPLKELDVAKPLIKKVLE